MLTTHRSTALVATALTALCLLLAACGQTVSGARDGGGPTAVAEPGPASSAGDADSPARGPEADGSEPVAESEPAEGSGSAADAEEAEPAEPAEADDDSRAAEEPEPDPEPEEAEAPSPPPRQVADSGWAPFATVAGVVLHHPSSRVERVGFHEANHDGARQLEVLASAVAPVTLESRDRPTGSRSAADVVVDPGVEIRAPVTGTVLRAGTYVLYCDYSDDYVVIEPDDHPGWEVKLLHIDGVRVEQGQRVAAGETVLAPRPTPLPFESQIDEHTAEPSWPHVHVEVVDPSIPDEPSGGGC